MYMYLLIEFLVILQEMNAYITLFPKAVSHFFQLLAHTFPEKLPSIRNVSQPQKLFWSINVFIHIHTWGLHMLGTYWHTTWQYISILCNDKRTERWYTRITRGNSFASLHPKWKEMLRKATKVHVYAQCFSLSLQAWEDLATEVAHHRWTQLSIFN